MTSQNNGLEDGTVYYDVTVRTTNGTVKIEEALYLGTFPIARTRNLEQPGYRRAIISMEGEIVMQYRFRDYIFYHGKLKIPFAVTDTLPDRKKEVLEERFGKRGKGWIILQKEEQESA